ncbi:hypothetical protein MKX01_031406 [Papaver californicum]|nr:hypothetical protein MKX01_031406 [Papaver californicum]
MSLLDFILSYIILFFILLTTITCQETCSSVQCDVDQPKISFPFGIKELHQGEQCAYPGFNLACNILKKTVLELPSALGKFYVRDINYVKKEIRLYDQLKCIPQRYLDSGETNISPFRGFASHTYRFYDCPVSIQTNAAASQTLALYTFSATCISNLWPPIITPYSSSDPTQVRVNKFLTDYGCSLKASILIPIPPSAVNIYSYNVATDDLYLTWTDPEKHVNNGTSPGKGEKKEEKTEDIVAKAVGITVGGILLTSIVYCLWGRQEAWKTGTCYARVCCCSGVC